MIKQLLLVYLLPFFVLATAQLGDKVFSGTRIYREFINANKGGTADAPLTLAALRAKCY